MAKTLIILNPNAGGGRAGKIWRNLEPLLIEKLGELVVAITNHPEEVAAHVGTAYTAGLRRVISVGGDGTNHSLINALADFNSGRIQDEQMEYGILPVGTGRDWARAMDIPLDVEKAADWIANASPRPIDIGMLRIDKRKESFLNVASAGIGGDVVARVNHVRERRSWTFLQKTVESLLRYSPLHMQISLDGELWYTGATYALAVANGTTFGRGMKVAPHAEVDDGWFDVILMKAMGKIQAISALRLLYDGSHLNHPKVASERAKQVRITSEEGEMMLELDGEFAVGSELEFEVKSGVLQMLDVMDE